MRSFIKSHRKSASSDTQHFNQSNQNTYEYEILQPPILIDKDKLLKPKKSVNVKTTPINSPNIASISSFNLTPPPNYANSSNSPKKLLTPIRNFFSKNNSSNNLNQYNYSTNALVNSNGTGAQEDRRIKKTQSNINLNGYRHDPIKSTKTYDWSNDKRSSLNSNSYSNLHCSTTVTSMSDGSNEKARMDLLQPAMILQNKLFKIDDFNNSDLSIQDSLQVSGKLSLLSSTDPHLKTDSQISLGSDLYNNNTVNSKKNQKSKKKKKRITKEVSFQSPKQAQLSNNPPIQTDKEEEDLLSSSHSVLSADSRFSFEDYVGGRNTSVKYYKKISNRSFNSLSSANSFDDEDDDDDDDDEMDDIDDMDDLDEMDIDGFDDTTELFNRKLFNDDESINNDPTPKFAYGNNDKLHIDTESDQDHDQVLDGDYQYSDIDYESFPDEYYQDLEYEDEDESPIQTKPLFASIQDFKEDYKFDGNNQDDSFENHIAESSSENTDKKELELIEISSPMINGLTIGYENNVRRKRLDDEYSNDGSDIEARKKLSCNLEEIIDLKIEEEKRKSEQRNSKNNETKNTLDDNNNNNNNRQSINDMMNLLINLENSNQPKRDSIAGLMNTLSKLESHSASSHSSAATTRTTNDSSMERRDSVIALMSTLASLEGGSAENLSFNSNNSSTSINTIKQTKRNSTQRNSIQSMMANLLTLETENDTNGSAKINRNSIKDMMATLARLSMEIESPTSKIDSLPKIEENNCNLAADSTKKKNPLRKLIQQDKNRYSWYDNDESLDFTISGNGPITQSTSIKKIIPKPSKLSSKISSEVQQDDEFIFHDSMTNTTSDDSLIDEINQLPEDFDFEELEYSNNNTPQENTRKLNYLRSNSYNKKPIKSVMDSNMMSNKIETLNKTVTFYRSNSGASVHRSGSSTTRSGGGGGGGGGGRSRTDSLNSMNSFTSFTEEDEPDIPHMADKNNDKSVLKSNDSLKSSLFNLGTINETNN